MPWPTSWTSSMICHCSPSWRSIRKILVGSIIFDDPGKSGEIGMGFDIAVTVMAAGKPCRYVIEVLAPALHVMDLC